MTNVNDGVLVIAIGDVWTELPAEVDGAEEGIRQIVAGFALDDESAERRLEHALGAVARVALELPAGARRNYALVPAPHSGTVEALLSMRVSRVTADAYDNYLAAASGLESDDRLEVIRRTVDEVVLPSGRGVLSRDFTLPVGAGGVPDPAMERTFLALFPDGGDSAVEFTLLTQNLALFSDAGEYLLALAANENPTVTETTELP